MASNNEKNGAPTPQEDTRESLSILDRLTLSAIGGKRLFGLPTDPFRTQFPELWRWLSQTDVGEGYVKQPARATVALTPEGVAVSLYDPSLGSTVEAVCQHLGDWAKALEAELKSATPKVRMSTRKIGGIKKKPKT